MCGSRDGFERWARRRRVSVFLLDWFADNVVQRGLDPNAGPPAEYESRNAWCGIASRAYW